METTARKSAARESGREANSLSRRFGTSWIPVLFVFLIVRMVDGEPTPAKVEFRRDIRPILSDNCFKCHGPDRRNRKARLRLDNKKGAFRVRRGRAAIIPGKAEESILYRLITTDSEDERMPPPDSGKSLTRDEVESIRWWIEQGAEWQEHWAFVSPQRPPPPQVMNEKWVRNEIDRLVLARLEARGLAPAQPADRRTLIRRVTFDLTGLPPTLAEVEAFVADTDPDAYEKVVDRLLGSPHYGEHMARYWLDAARYGDTHGLHLDNMRTMWPYRDWVIRALNDNMPFDQFTIEQLAGDLLPSPTLEDRIATGFNRCNVTTSEGGAINEEFYVRYAVDRVETTATVWMGLTAGCAACHEHKFDPISQKEFYELFAFFNNITEPAMDGNKAAVPPFAEVPLPGAAAELAELRPRIAGVERKMKEREKACGAEFDAWVREAAARAGKRVEQPAGLVAHYPLDGSGVANLAQPEQVGHVQGKPEFVPGRFGNAFTVGDSHIDLGEVGDFEGDREFSYGAWIRTPGNVTGAPIARMNSSNNFRGWDLYIQARRVAMHLIHRWSDLAIKLTTKADVLEPNRWHHVFVTYDGSRRAGGVTIYVDGEARPCDVNNDTLGDKTARAKVPLYVGRRHSGSPFKGGEVDDVRIYGRRLSPTEVASVAGVDPIRPILALPPAERTAQQNQLLLEHFLGHHDETHKRLTAELGQLRARERGLAGRKAATLVMEERKKPRGAYVLYRGQYDQRREEVTPATPAALPPMPEDAPRNRLGFARWLVDPSHPLTARVTVNRMWQQKFGTGIVRTAEDFGSQGEPPSHPRLLDWLATEFTRTGWDVKRMHRLVVTSATYRQSSRITAELLQEDPDNRLLARGPRFRLDAEMLRDQALALSGLLVKRLGGPSVKPPQPSGLWYAVGYTSSNTARFKQDSGEAVYRRSLYTFWKRTAPPPAMSTFDAPSRESCTVRRERTNTPLQALLLMNDRQYVESARDLAQRALREGGRTPRARATFLFRLATARPPEAADLEDILGAFEDHLVEYRKDPARADALIHVGDSTPDASLDPVELAAWTMVGNLLLNLDEVITKG